MTQQPLRVQFFPTGDERVEAAMRFWRKTPYGERVRRRGRAKALACAWGLAFVVTFAMNGAQPPAVFGSAVLATIAAALISPLSGELYDRGVERRSKKIGRELYGSVNSMPCDIEPRTDGLWVRDLSIEMLIPWSEFVEAGCVGGDLELRFHHGLVIARARAFASDADRDAFLDAVRTFAAQTNS